MTMMVNDWATEYFNWLKSKTVTTPLNGWDEVVTPFVDRHNDRIVIYIRRDGSVIRMTDDGYTIADLEATGCSLDTVHRKSVLSGFLSSFGVKLVDNELVVEANDQTFAQKKHFLIQAILSVNDMFMLSRNQVANLFFDDLNSFLTDNNIRYITSVQFLGISGFLHRMDFVIPKSKNRPERMISSINNPTVDRAKVLLFNWNDIQQSRPVDSVMYVFLNDNNSVSNNVISACMAYSTVPVLWSNRNDIIDQLTA